MKILAIASPALALALSVVLFFMGGFVNAKQSKLQKETQVVQSESQEIQLLQGQLQQQEQKVNAANSLQQQVGPQVVTDLKVLAVKSNNAKLLALLARHNKPVTDEEKVQIEKLLDQAAKQQTPATPAPALRPGTPNP